MTSIITIPNPLTPKDMTPEEHTLDNMVLHCMTAIKSDPTYKRFSNGLNIDYMNDPLSNPEITMELNIRKALKPFAEQYATQRKAGEVPTIEQIKKALYECSKIEMQDDGVKMTRIFEEEAQAMLKLFSPHHQTLTPNPAERK